MKSNHDLRTRADVSGTEDLIRKAAKLEPMKKSGKEKRAFIREMDEDDDDFGLSLIHKKESVLDYYDDGDTDEEADTEDEWEEMDEDDDDLDDDWEEDLLEKPNDAEYEDEEEEDEED